MYDDPLSVASRSGSTSRFDSPNHSGPTDMSNCQITLQFQEYGKFLNSIGNGDVNEVCSMLYHGVNVYKPMRAKFHFIAVLYPLRFAIRDNNINIVTLLIDFYDDLYSEQKYSGEVSVVCQLLEDCLRKNDDATLFKLLWRKINHDDLLCDQQLYLLLLSVVHIIYNKFVIADWLECLYLIFKNFNKPAPLFSLKNYNNFYTCLFAVFSIKNLQQENRLRITNICLGLGIPATWDDYKFVYSIYGFGDELEALIYGMNFIKGPEPLCKTKHILCPEYCKRLKCRPLNGYLHGLGIHSLSVEEKQRIKIECENYDVESKLQIFEKLDRVPEFPTLLELCRNQIRKSINYQSFKYPYQFHDAIKTLNLPRNICDVIRFKTELYC